MVDQGIGSETTSCGRSPPRWLVLLVSTSGPGQAAKSYREEHFKDCWGMVLENTVYQRLVGILDARKGEVTRARQEGPRAGETTETAQEALAPFAHCRQNSSSTGKDHTKGL